MTVETMTSGILLQISGIGKCRVQFLVHLVRLYLSIRGRINFLSMERYGQYGEQTYRQHFERPMDFKTFNELLIRKHCSKDLAWVFDPSYINKSGKHTPGVGYFWSGCAGRMKWGLELSALGIIDVENHTAMHYEATRTTYDKGAKDEESLRKFYAKLILNQSERMQKLSKTMIVDAFFSKLSFVEPLSKAGFVLISRLQSNACLRYRYLGEQKGGKGRKKTFAERVDLKKLNPLHFTEISRSEEEVAYEGVVHVRALKRWCKVVVVQTLKEDGSVKKALCYFSTDVTIKEKKVWELYGSRFQIEFLFRDAKGHLGLEHCQSRQEEALDFHFNHALTTLNLAKATHWLSVDKEQRGPFSMADIKTQYSNQLLLDRIISIYGKDPSVEKNNPKIKELYQLGRIAA